MVVLSCVPCIDRCDCNAVLHKNNTAMEFLSRWRKGRSVQEDKEKIPPKSEADGFSIRSGKHFKLWLMLNSLVMASALLLVVIISALRVEVSLPQLPGTLSVKNRAINMKAETEALDLILKTEKSPTIFIEDAVILPEEVLLLVRSSEDFKFNRKKLSCIFFNQSTTVLGVDNVGKRIAVRCEIPLQGLPTLPNGVALLQSRGEESILIEVLNKSMPFVKWNHLVFEALMLPSEVILFAKGFGEKHGQVLIDEDIWRCAFDERVDTRVTVAAQEVFRCENPPPSLQFMLLGKKVTLRRNGKLIPSVAYYQPDIANLRRDQLLDSSTTHSKRPRQESFLCACTMIFNGAKFLKEWLTYHSFLGVEHFYLYDNNSEDDLQDAVQRLARYNVSRHSWPWIKSQEAGFSHCSQQAKAQCTWMMYTDIDEFIYPRAWLSQSKTSYQSRVANSSNDPAKELPILKALILQTSDAKDAIGRPAGRKIGQISLKCREFGPSGLKNNPPEGVMQGYTCRMKKEQRHKSIVQLDTIATSLINIVHHFKLQPDFETVQLSARKAVINHYKYQVWEEFKKKFKRRVSAYVTDWTVNKKMVSKDRAPGLGTKAIEPPGWENMFCEVHDTALGDYARHLANSSLLSWK